MPLPPSDMETKAGRCMCGSIRILAIGEPLRVTVCHCSWCQRRTGSAFGVEVVYLIDQVKLEGQTIARHRHISDESGRWLEVEFCKECGCNLGFTLEAVPGIRTIPAGAFDDPEWIRADHVKFQHVYLRSRRNWGDVGPHVEVHEQHFRK
jgi:hypothetical protein